MGQCLVTWTCTLTRRLLCLWTARRWLTTPLIRARRSTPLSVGGQEEEGSEEEEAVQQVQGGVVPGRETEAVVVGTEGSETMVVLGTGGITMVGIGGTGETTMVAGLRSTEATGIGETEARGRGEEARVGTGDRVVGVMQTEEVATAWRVGSGSRQDSRQDSSKVVAAEAAEGTKEAKKEEAMASMRVTQDQGL